MSETSGLMRRVLLSIRTTPFECKPKWIVGKWKIYDAGRVKDLPVEDQIRNLNFQIQRNDLEKILVRIFLNSDRVIVKTKYYYIHTDEELAFYLTRVVINKLKKEYLISHKHELFEIKL
jgi:hypothetical protein